MEKRNQNRIGKRLFVRFGKEKPEKLGFTEDISTTGLFIRTSTVFQPGTHLKIDLTLPDQRILHLMGCVMWAKQVPQNLIRFAKKGGMGIRLTHAGEDYQRSIATLGSGAKEAGS